MYQISDSLAGVFISDVMGHGSAALVAAMLRTLVEDSRPYAADPPGSLRELNRGISEISKSTHLPIFVSAFYLAWTLNWGDPLRECWPSLSAPHSPVAKKRGGFAPTRVKV